MSTPLSFSSSHGRRLQILLEGDQGIYQHAHFGQKMPVHKATFGAEVGAICWSGERMLGWGPTLQCGEPDVRLLPGNHSQGTISRTGLCLVSLVLILCPFFS